MFNIRIIKMGLAQINNINKPIEPFLVIGKIRIRKNWNEFCFIEDLAISKSCRRKGLGSVLIQKAIN
jgi:hypothetical protein